MTAIKELAEKQLHLQEPINLNTRDFNENKYAYYQWLREEAPVCKGKVTVFDAYLLSRYEDCMAILRDPRVVRNRSRVTGGGRMPFPTPKALTVMMKSMIFEDEPEHRRLRTLVHKAFTPRSLIKLEERLETITYELLDKAKKHVTGYWFLEQQDYLQLWADSENKGELDEPHCNSRILLNNQRLFTRPCVNPVTENQDSICQIDAQPVHQSRFP
jgi:cytochrome P450